MSKHSVQITKITCQGTSEVGHDEVYLVCQADAGIPLRYPAHLADSVSMSSSDNTWNLNSPDLILHFNYEVLVTLWDCDISYLPTFATFLQCHDFEPGSGSGTISLSNPDGAKYTLYYTYLS